MAGWRRGMMERSKPGGMYSLLLGRARASGAIHVIESQARVGFSDMLPEAVAGAVAERMAGVGGIEALLMMLLDDAVERRCAGSEKQRHEDDAGINRLHKTSQRSDGFTTSYRPTRACTLMTEPKKRERGLKIRTRACTARQH